MPGLTNTISTLVSVALLAASLTNTAAFAEPANLRNIPQIISRFDNARLFCKTSLTHGRLPKESSIGRLLITWVADEQGDITEETSNIISDDVVIARNPKELLPGLYNEWLVPKARWLENYGRLPKGHDYEKFARIKPIKAIPVDVEVLNLLGSTDNSTATIAVNWNPEGMKVYLNGYLANYEYGIAPEEMENTYQELTEGHICPQPDNTE